MLAARKDRDVVSSASVDFLMFSGYVMMVYFWARQAAVASEKLASGEGPRNTLNSIEQKLKFRLLFERLLPRTQGHAGAMVDLGKP